MERKRSMKSSPPNQFTAFDGAFEHSNIISFLILSIGTHFADGGGVLTNTPPRTCDAGGGMCGDPCGVSGTGLCVGVGSGNLRLGGQGGGHHRGVAAVDP